MKRFTVGITTHNEEKSIAALLDQLGAVDSNLIDIILYDDGSTDHTRSMVLRHPLASKPHFHSHFSKQNYGSPSAGRSYIGAQAKTEYTTLIDGDDYVIVDGLVSFIHEAPSGYDILVSPYAMNDKKVGVKSVRGKLTISNKTILPLLSGIAGKAYNSKLLAQHAPDSVRGRGDDTRLNMRILSSSEPRIFSMPDACFYLHEEFRKSVKVATLNFDELRERARRYGLIRERYDLDNRYIGALRRNLFRVISADPNVPSVEKSRLLSDVKEIFPMKVRNIILIANNISSIGGISGRLRSTQKSSIGRNVRYHLLSTVGDESVIRSIPNCLCVATDEKKIKDLLRSLDSCDTVVLTANNLMQQYPPDIRNLLRRLPIIYMNSAQMAFMIQDSHVIYDVHYVAAFRASAIICLSDADIAFQKQLGLHGQVKGFLPVATRTEYRFQPATPLRLGYVGRLDFQSKGCERLIGVAQSLKAARLPPIKMFTTAEKNSPSYAAFMSMIEEEDLNDQFEFTMECTDKDILYRDISLLLLPSKKESFGNVVLEAFSYGIPVISTTYAPGPSELIDHGKTGFLLTDFTGENILEIINRLTLTELEAMSAAAFEKHKDYSMDNHFAFLESLSSAVLNDFTGLNELPVFPELKVAKKYTSLKAAKIAASEKTTSLIRAPITVATKPMRPAKVEIARGMTRAEQLKHRLAPFSDEIARLEKERALRHGGKRG